MEKKVLVEEVEVVPVPDVAPILLEFGKKSKRLIRQLSEGRGRLFEEVTAAVSDLKTAGTISSNAQPVIVVVKQKQEKRGLFGL